MLAAGGTTTVLADVAYGTAVRSSSVDTGLISVGVAEEFAYGLGVAVWGGG